MPDTAMDALFRGDLRVCGQAGDRGWFLGGRDLATECKLNLPWGVAVDSSGNVYIADYENNYVRKVSITDHNIYAYAGYAYTATIQDPGGYYGNNVAATSAELYAPMGLAVDSSNSLFITDSANQRIREVYISGTIPNVSSPTAGHIYTVAGNGTTGFSGDSGLATSAELNNPAGVAVDPSDNLYIADSYNQRIRLVAHSTGDTSTVAGSSASGFSGDGGAATSAKLSSGVPGVAVDGSYSIYIADWSNQRIRIVGAVG